MVDELHLSPGSTPPTSEISVAGLHAIRRGSGPPLLLLHGIGHRLQMWTPVLDRLAEDFDVVALDLPGFGKSPPIPTGSDITLAVGVDLLETALDELGWERAHLVGNSLGGWLAFELGRRDRALSICGLAPAGLWPADSRAVERRLRFWFSLWVGAARRLPEPVVRLLRFRMVRTLALSRLFGKPWRIPPDIAVEDAHNLATSSFDAVFEAGVGERFVDGQGIDVPVTVTWHSRDPLFDARRCSVAELPSHTRVLRLSGCGHVPTWDDPPAVLDVIHATAAAAP